VAKLPTKEEKRDTRWDRYQAKCHEGYLFSREIMFHEGGKQIVIGTAIFCPGKVGGHDYGAHSISALLKKNHNCPDDFAAWNAMRNAKTEYKRQNCARHPETGIIVPLDFSV